MEVEPDVASRAAISREEGAQTDVRPMEVDIAAPILAATILQPVPGRCFALHMEVGDVANMHNVTNQLKARLFSVLHMVVADDAQSWTVTSLPQAAPAFVSNMGGVNGARKKDAPSQVEVRSAYVRSIWVIA